MGDAEDQSIRLSTLKKGCDMQQHLTRAQREFVRLNPTVGYEQDAALEEEIELAFDFQLEAEAPIARFAAEKRGQADESRLSDPTWIERFDSEAEASFNRSFATLLDESPHPRIPSVEELCSLATPRAPKAKALKHAG